MDPLLPLLLPLARLDDDAQTRADRIRRVRHELAQAASATSAAKTSLAEATAARDTTAAANAADEAELKRYDDQRKAALRVLETGVGNIAAAERQFAACKDAIDTLEGTVLERLDVLAADEARVEAASRTLDAAKKAQIELEARHQPELASLLAAASAADAQRLELAAALPVAERQQYLTTVAKKGTALAALTSAKACAACSRALPVDVAARVLKGALHVCAGCTRWVYSPPA